MVAGTEANIFSERQCGMKTILQEPRYFCALGAQQAVTAIDRAIPIIHAGPGCSAKLFQAMAGSGGNQGAGYAGGDSIPCTNMIERDVVFGGAEKLHGLIESTLKVMDGDLFCRAYRLYVRSCRRRRWQRCP